MPPTSTDEPLQGHALPLLFNLVYCSRAAPGVDDAEVARIIEVARRRNAVHGITGLLVYGSGIFVQWLEGPRDEVMQLLANIQLDARHHDVVSLSQAEEVRERLFPDWDMELVGADDIRDVLLDAQSASTNEKSSAVLQQLLDLLDAGQLSGLIAH
jgi:Sensors of blue-light using FAD